MILFGLVLLVVVLRRLGLSRWLALTAATIFGLIPSHSTLRFWMIGDITNLSLLLYLVSLWADLRLPSGGLGRVLAWRVLSAVAAASSILAYASACRCSCSIRSPVGGIGRADRRLGGYRFGGSADRTAGWPSTWR